MKRLIVIAVMLGAAAPAGFATPEANAATSAKPTPMPELQGGPVALGKLGRFPGYRMVVTATGRSGGQVVVTVGFERRQGGAVQGIAYSFILPGGALRVGRRLMRATLDTRSALGRFGRIRMTFTCRRRRPSAPGCFGSPRGRRGTLAGVLDVRTDFGARIRRRSLPARLTLKKPPSTTPSPGGNPSCSQYPHSAVLAVGPVATATAHNFVLGGFLAARRRVGPVGLLVGVIRNRPPAIESAGIASPAPRSAFRLAGTRSARVNAAGVPFFRGRLSFSRTGPLPGCQGRGAVGTATGSMRARFDFFGTVALLKAPRTPAILLGPGSR